MIAMVLMVAALAVAWIGGLLGEGGRVWRAASALLVAALVGVLWFGGVAGAPGDDLWVSAEAPDGGAVAATVILKREGSARQVRSVPLKVPVSQSAMALWAMLVLGSGAGVWLAQRRDRERLAAALPALAALSAAGLVASATAVGGPEAVQVFVEGALRDLPVQQYWAPDVAWHYATPLRWPLMAVAAISVLAAGSAWRPELTPLRRLPWLGAAGVLGVCAFLARTVGVGGLPAGPMDGAFWMVGMLLAGAWWHRRAPERAASLVTVATLVFALAAAVTTGG